LWNRRARAGPGVRRQHNGAARTGRWALERPYARAQVENTFFDDLIVVSNTTNSTLVCENKSPFLNGGTLMLIGAPAVRARHHPFLPILVPEIVARSMLR
jgi:hypothetical protein